MIAGFISSDNCVAFDVNLRTNFIASLRLGPFVLSHNFHSSSMEALNSRYDFKKTSVPGTAVTG